MAGQKQHVDAFRKLALRRQLLRGASPGAAYVPFCGDGDIASEIYADRRVLAADLDPARVATCAARLDNADVRTADCNGWPFPGCDDVFAVADFDSYAYPYDSFRSWWDNAEKADRLVVFFTDGEKQAIVRSGYPRFPDGTKFVTKGMTANERRPFFNFWYLRHCVPWLKSAVGPYKVVKVRNYQRGMMIYWGASLER
jgi:hypothetical protein